MQKDHNVHLVNVWEFSEGPSNQNNAANVKNKLEETHCA